MTFDFTAFPSRVVEILLDALHFDVVVIAKENREFTILFELIIFLLDDGKLRYKFYCMISFATLPLVSNIKY